MPLHGYDLCELNIYKEYEQQNENKNNRKHILIIKINLKIYNNYSNSILQNKIISK